MRELNTEYRAKINKNGCLSIPAIYRKALDIRPGEEVILRLADNELHICTIRQSLERARKLVKQYVRANENLSDGLISDRRKEALHE